jgi:hypothetical protein
MTREQAKTLWGFIGGDNSGNLKSVLVFMGIPVHLANATEPQLKKAAAFLREWADATEPKHGIQTKGSVNESAERSAHEDPGDKQGGAEADISYTRSTRPL